MFTKHILIDDAIAAFKPYSGIAEAQQTYAVLERPICQQRQVSNVGHFVKTDTLNAFLNDTTESYFIRPARMDFAKMDALEVKIIQTSAG